MKRKNFVNASIFVVLIKLLIMSTLCAQSSDRIVIVYNNLCQHEGLEEQWGFSAWVECNNRVILFDTGTKGEILDHNLEKLNLEKSSIDQIVISHKHSDHMGGLAYLKEFLSKDIKVHFPASELSIEQKEILDGLNVEIKDGFRKIDDGIWIMPVMKSLENMIPEQSLVIEKDDSFIVITGCAHPGIVGICKKAVEQFPNKTPELVTGGTHLSDFNNDAVKEISDNVKSLGYKKIAPSHCTGERAIEQIKDEWKDNFVRLYLGDEYKF